jgi:hypothetical protein
MRMKSDQLHVPCLVYTIIFSTLWNFSNIVISLSWHIKQAKHHHEALSASMLLMSLSVIEW